MNIFYGAHSLRSRWGKVSGLFRQREFSAFFHLSNWGIIHFFICFHASSSSPPTLTFISSFFHYFDTRQEANALNEGDGKFPCNTLFSTTSRCVLHCFSLFTECYVIRERNFPHVSTAFLIMSWMRRTASMHFAEVYEGNFQESSLQKKVSPPECERGKTFECNKRDVFFLIQSCRGERKNQFSSIFPLQRARVSPHVQICVCNEFIEKRLKTGFSVFLDSFFFRLTPGVKGLRGEMNFQRFHANICRQTDRFRLHRKE